MAKQVINNGDSGLSARTKINSNFTETYNNSVSNSDNLTAVVSDLSTHKGAINPHGITAASINASPTTHTHTQANGTISGFSQDNFTTAEKTKLSGLSNFDNSANVTALAKKLETSNIIAGTNITVSTTGNNVTINSAATGGGGGGTLNHNELNNLTYVASGHTGFQPSGDYATNTALTTHNASATAHVDIRNVLITHGHNLGDGTTSGFTQNDFTTAEKTKLSGLNNFDNTVNVTALNTHNTSVTAHNDIRTDLALKATNIDLTTHTSNSAIHLTTAQTTAISLLNGATGNIQTQLDNLSGVFNNTFVEDTKAILNAVDSDDNDIGIVRIDETLSNQTTMYVYKNNSWVFLVVLSVEIRNFLTSPINLATETTGTLQSSKIDVLIARQTEITRLDSEKEPLIATKNSAFNTSFGVTAGTSCQGNDTRLTDSRTPTSHNQPATTIIQDANNRFATDSEKIIWNAKVSQSELTTELALKATTASLTTHTSNAAIHLTAAQATAIGLLNGATSNIQTQIDNLKSVFNEIFVFNTNAEMQAFSTDDNDIAIVRSDIAPHLGLMTMYLRQGGVWIFLNEMSIDVRNFLTDPINIITETTGVLPQARIDALIARTSDIVAHNALATAHADIRTIITTETTNRTAEDTAIMDYIAITIGDIASILDTIVEGI